MAVCQQYVTVMSSYTSLLQSRLAENIHPSLRRLFRHTAQSTHLYLPSSLLPSTRSGCVPTTTRSSLQETTIPPWVTKLRSQLMSIDYKASVKPATVGVRQNQLHPSRKLMRPTISMESSVYRAGRRRAAGGGYEAYTNICQYYQCPHPQ